MTSIVDWYILFCLTTSITAAIELLSPVLAKQVTEKGRVESKVTIYIVFMIITTIFAPAIFFSCIIPSMSERFKLYLYKGLFPEE